MSYLCQYSGIIVEELRNTVQDIGQENFRINKLSVQRNKIIDKLVGWRNNISVLCTQT
jgi:hypothetical protein